MNGWLLAGEIVVGVAAVLAALGAIARSLHLGTLRREIHDFLADWNGEPERDGYPGRKSFPARLAEVELQLKNNGGSSLRDALDRVEAASVEAKRRAEEAADRAAELTGHLGRADSIGRKERAYVLECVIQLTETVTKFMADARLREAAYVEKAQELGFDLTGVTEHLNNKDLEG